MNDAFLTDFNKDAIDTVSTARKMRTRPLKIMSDQKLLSLPPGSVFFFDVESYTNFFFVAFKLQGSNEVVVFEKSPSFELERDKLLWMCHRFLLVGFNSINYDLPIVSLACHGASIFELKMATNLIIVEEAKPWDIERVYDIKIIEANHIDIIQVAPLQGSLKLYAARMHSHTIQDLPFPPSHLLTFEDAEIMRPYCKNDLDLTSDLYDELEPFLDIRKIMSKTHGVDLRSKSDAQIAEAVIKSGLAKLTKKNPRKPKINLHKKLHYKTPDFLKFETKNLQNAVVMLERLEFSLDKNGSPVIPEELAEMTIRIGGGTYNLQIGGLHSQEKSTAHFADDETILADDDVASFYPWIILICGLYPAHLGEAFLTVYRQIVLERLEAKANAATYKANRDFKKAEGPKSIADCLKIVINGLFGKFGNKYSVVYSPELMLQVTITGQLLLLMLIERLHLAGILVVSANTDGIVSKYKNDKRAIVRDVIAKWEADTGFSTEESSYTHLFSRDVNNYIAVKKDSARVDAEFLDDRLGCKTKGTYAERGSALNSVLSKNPENLICKDAALEFLINDVPVQDTIRKCGDVRRFLSVRNVKGGGVYDNVYLGKVVRWYHSTKSKGNIVYFNSGNQVANTFGAKPLMVLPDTLPEDIDYDYYVEEALRILIDIGKTPQLKTKVFNF